MNDIAKELFKSIVTGTASQEDFGSAIKQKMDQALDVRRAGITADIYNKQVPSSETVVEESVDLEEAKIPSSNISIFSDPKLAKSAASKQKYKTQVFVGDDGKFLVPSTNKEAGQLKKDGYKVYESNDIEESSKNKALAKDLEKLIKNPDPSRVKEYGGGTKYVDMLKSKLAKLQEDSTEIAEASSGDISKLLKFVAKNGAKVKGNVADFGGSKIEFSFDKGKIKFDGGKDSGVEYFDNLRDAISALSIAMED